jgi:hypothetical protein
MNMASLEAYNGVGKIHTMGIHEFTKIDTHKEKYFHNILVKKNTKKNNSLQLSKNYNL